MPLWKNNRCEDIIEEMVFELGLSGAIFKMEEDRWIGRKRTMR